MAFVYDDENNQIPHRVSLQTRRLGPLPSSSTSHHAHEASGGVTATPHTTGTIPKITTDEKPRPGGVTATPHTTGTIPKITTDEDSAQPSQPDTPSFFQSIDSSIPTSTTTRPKKRIKDTRQPVFNGWVPDLQAAWSMLLIPVTCGIIISQFRWSHILLYAAWIMGYFTLFALDIWLRSGRKERYWAAVRTYTVLTTILCGFLLIVTPSLLEWAIVFLVLTSIGMYDPARKRRRTLVTMSATMAAASLMLIVAYDIGTGFARSSHVLPWVQYSTSTGFIEEPWVPVNVSLDGYSWATVMALAFFAYYWTNIFYVTSMVHRQRGKRVYVTSAVLHTLVCIIIWVAAAFHMLPIGHAVIWLIVWVRAITLPIIAIKLRSDNADTQVWATYVSPDNSEPSLSESISTATYKCRQLEVTFSEDTPSAPTFTRIVLGMELVVTILLVVTLFI
ncbi:MAG: YwiC-like family protein [Actinomycetaceae bacterium]|nr:YwiC-like family protein [Actinomycetaceae bacterium]